MPTKKKGLHASANKAGDGKLSCSSGVMWFLHKPYMNIPCLLLKAIKSSGRYQIYKLGNRPNKCQVLHQFL